MKLPRSMAVTQQVGTGTYATQIRTVFTVGYGGSTPPYTGIDSCTGWWVEFELENTGSIPFKSIGITVRDTVTDVVVASFADDFINKNGCNSTTTRDTLAVGKSPVVSGPIFNYDPTGHKLRATIILCSDTGQSGTCVTKTKNFTP